MNDVPAHPVAAELAASLLPGPPLSYPPEALERVRAKLRVQPDGAIVRDLLALGVRAHRLAGAAAQPMILQLAELVAEALGGHRAAADGFVAAGLSAEAANMLGTSTPTRAPEEKKAAAPQVKARRGLQKP